MSRRLLLLAVVVLLFFVGMAVILFLTQGGGPAQKVSYDLIVTGDKMAPTSHLTAHQGDHLTITIHVDRKEEIHLHGYDKHFEGEPGKPVTHTFTADKTGTFDIEVEDTSTPLGELVVSPR